MENEKLLLQEQNNKLLEEEKEKLKKGLKNERFFIFSLFLPHIYILNPSKYQSTK